MFGLYIVMTIFIPSVHPCDKENNGGCKHICKKKGDGVQCACNTGFKLNSDQVSCVESKNMIWCY